MNKRQKKKKHTMFFKKLRKSLKKGRLAYGLIESTSFIRVKSVEEMFNDYYVDSSESKR